MIAGIGIPVYNARNMRKNRLGFQIGDAPFGLSAIPVFTLVVACSQKAWNERIGIFANLSKNRIEIRIKSPFSSLII